MGKAACLAAIILLLFGSFDVSFPAASAPGKEDLKASLYSVDRVCTVLHETVLRHEDVRRVVKTGIELGYGACPVVTCALDAGGSLNEVIAGAVEAGATPDVLSRCCVEAGAAPNAVAAALSRAGNVSLCYFGQPGLGYSQPGEGLVPIDTSMLGRDTGTRAVSPSSF